MKQIIAQSLTTLLAALLLFSCSADDDVTSSAQVNIRFTIAMNSTGTRSGTWGDDDYTKEEATQWENSIFSGKLQVLVYDKDDNFMCEVCDLVLVPLSSNTVQVWGSLPFNEIDADNGKLTCRLVVLANFDNRVSPAKGDKLEKIARTTYTFNAKAIANKEAYIPMWGVQTYKASNSTDYQPLTVQSGETAEANTIHMLRAMSKIRVSVTDDVANDYTVQDVSISNYNLYGYLMPAGYTADSATDLSYEDNGEFISFNPYTDKNNNALSFSPDDTGKNFTVYLPEYQTSVNSTTGLTDPYISITLKPKAESASASTYRINMFETTSDETMNLIRNTIYSYTITSVGPDLSLRYQAIDWTEGGGDISFD